MSELRDLYAGLAMHALIVNDKYTNFYHVADAAFEIADLMIEKQNENEREKE